MTRIFSLELTDDEADRFEAAAARLGYTVAEYLRRCVIGVPVVTIAKIRTAGAASWPPTSIAPARFNSSTSAGWPL